MEFDLVQKRPCSPREGEGGRHQDNTPWRQGNEASSMVDPPTSPRGGASSPLINHHYLFLTPFAAILIRGRLSKARCKRECHVAGWTKQHKVARGHEVSACCIVIGRHITTQQMLPRTSGLLSPSSYTKPPLLKGEFTRL